MTSPTSITLNKGREAHTMKLLPIDYVLGDKDVLCCARGSRCFHHVGNQIFRMLVEANLERYAKAITKFDKTSIICEIVHVVRRSSPDGGFVKKDLASGRYYEVGDFLAREKTSQAFRDALDGKHKKSVISAKAAKTARCQKNLSPALLEVCKHSSDLSRDQKASNAQQHQQSVLPNRTMSLESHEKLETMLEKNCELLDDLINVKSLDTVPYYHRQHTEEMAVLRRKDNSMPQNTVFMSCLADSINYFDRNVKSCCEMNNEGRNCDALHLDNSNKCRGSDQIINGFYGSRSSEPSSSECTEIDGLDQIQKSIETRNQLSTAGHADHHYNCNLVSSDACATMSEASYDRAQFFGKKEKYLQAYAIKSDNIFEVSYTANVTNNHDINTDDERTFDLLLQFSERYTSDVF